MDDYIKREDAINTVRNTFTGMTADTLELRINDIPSADVAPVWHGRWVRGDKITMFDLMGKIADGRYYTCQCCGFMKFVFDEHDSQYNYCPNCGAKMDGGGEE